MEKIKSIQLGNKFANMSITVSILILLFLVIHIILYLVLEYNALKFTLPAIVILPVLLIFGSIQYKKILKDA